MNKLMVASVFVVLALALPASAETRNVTGFTSVNASDRLTVEVVSGDAHSVQVTGADAARVRTRVENGTLRISNARRTWFGSGPRLDAHVRVTAPAIAGVAAARGAELTATISSACDDFHAAAAMGGSARVSGLRCNTVDASAAMGGELRIAGACRALSVSAAMGGDVRAGDLQCQTVDASAAMGGGVRAFASQSYDASAAMGGSINVAGGGTASDTSATMGGSISSSNR